jgi:hypothetical protein
MASFCTAKEARTASSKNHMINAFGAPIDQSDAEIIADYLKKNYSM